MIGAYRHCPCDQTSKAGSFPAGQVVTSRSDRLPAVTVRAGCSFFSNRYLPTLPGEKLAGNLA
ncbi:hypothetical protein AB0E88_27740 [Streptomyces sp. NPDC028635]|uniref:hypothetical protein n=1 Tax=Streptomyces sp. NPDC028635 TaxID=3154800 RepID=UPI0033FA166E